MLWFAESRCVLGSGFCVAFVDCLVASALGRRFRLCGSPVLRFRVWAVDGPGWAIHVALYDRLFLIELLCCGMNCYVVACRVSFPAGAIPFSHISYTHVHALIGPESGVGRFV
jgi:hypothetical protein